MLKDYSFNVEGTVHISAETKEAAEILFEDWVFHSPMFFEITTFEEE